MSRDRDDSGTGFLQIVHVVVDNLQYMLGSDASDGGGSTRSSFGIDRLSRQDSVFSSFRTLVNDARIHLTLVVHPRKVCPLLSPLQHYTYEHSHALFCTVNTVNMRVQSCSLFQCAGRGRLPLDEQSVRLGAPLAGQRQRAHSAGPGAHERDAFARSEQRL